MSDSDLLKKMLRAVLQSNKDGVSVTRLQSDYRSLTGEFIPHKQLGYPSLEACLRSMPSVVRMEHCMGELRCFAAVSQETAHIAKLVARQRSSKKARPRMVNCQMRFKPASPFMFSEKPRTSLRQPAQSERPVWGGARPRPRATFWSLAGRVSGAGDYRLHDSRHGASTPLQHRPPPTLSSTAPLQHRPPPTLSTAPPARTTTPLSYERRVTYPLGQQNLGRAMTVTIQKPDVSSSAASSSSPSSPCAAPQRGVYDPALVQRNVGLVLQKYCSGLWLSKLPAVYKERFNQEIHAQALIDLEKWAHVCSVEKPGSTNRADRLIYPPVKPKPTPSAVPIFTPSPAKAPPTPFTKPSFTPSTNSIFNFSATPASKTTCAPSLSSTFTFAAKPVPPPPPRKPTSKLEFLFRPPSTVPSPTQPTSTSFQANPRIPLQKGTSGLSPTSSLTPRFVAPDTPVSPISLSPGSSFPDVPATPATPLSPKWNTPATPPASPVLVPADVRAKLKELLSKYSQGLWAHALPKLFMDTYKTPFPTDVLANLSLLLDICTVEYPLPDNKDKAILYCPSWCDQRKRPSGVSPPPPSGIKVSPALVPTLKPPPWEPFPSVLVGDVKNGSTLTLRYIGEGFSQALEAMEDVMQAFYGEISNQTPVATPVTGQLAAVRLEEGEEMVRAQVTEVMAGDKVKVYCVDHGFSEVVSRSRLMELQQDFLQLPLQVTNCRLAGLESFSEVAAVVRQLEQMTLGRILLLETLEHWEGDTPLVVLYDTSKDEDVNVNAHCLRALQDGAMANPLLEDSVYTKVSVTNVCTDGTIHCQLPSRGQAKLNELLDKMEAFFMSQMTSELLVSRPFCGMRCLARYRGKWARAEITMLHGRRVLDVLFVDLGVPATEEVTELREIPPPLLHELLVIPPQAVKCCLAGLSNPGAGWTAEAVVWLRNAVQPSTDCSVKIVKTGPSGVVHVYLFTGFPDDVGSSVNWQMAQSGLCQPPSRSSAPPPPAAATSNPRPGGGGGGGDLSVALGQLSLSGPLLRAPPAPVCIQMALIGAGETPARDPPAKVARTEEKPLQLPPVLELPKVGENLDVYVSVACHPGHFVVQPWQDLYKLVVLMGEMMLYYSKVEARPVQVRKGEVYAAKVENSWHRVLVKGVLTNGLVSIYQLDYGKHELVSCTALLHPLIEEFRQLPFQAITAELAGVEQRLWSEAESIVFRNHVEKCPLVAKVEAVQQAALPWERKLTLYLVDTSQEDTDFWVHDIMANLAEELTLAA